MVAEPAGVRWQPLVQEEKREKIQGTYKKDNRDDARTEQNPAVTTTLKLHTLNGDPRWFSLAERRRKRKKMRAAAAVKAAPAETDEFDKPREKRSGYRWGCHTLRYCRRKKVT